MSDLTISKLIKLIIAGVVLVVVILGLYFSMTSYVIPFFKGLGFGSEGPGGGFVGEADVCEEEKLVGSLEKDGKLLYFKYENERTVFYIDKNKVYEKLPLNSLQVGEIVDQKITIFKPIFDEYQRLLKVYYKQGKFDSSDEKEFYQLLKLNNAVIKGNEICES